MFQRLFYVSQLIKISPPACAMSTKPASLIAESTGEDPRCSSTPSASISPPPSTTAAQSGFDLSDKTVTISGTRKRVPSPDIKVPPRKKKSAAAGVIDPAELRHVRYYFENGLRKVEPHYYTWKTYAKGRWVGRTLEDIFTAEFFAISDEVVRERLNADPSRLFVNGIRVDKYHKVKSGDYIAHYMHRHEMPVTDEPIEIVAETDDMLVVDKPASIPVHPCGRFRMNSVMYILALEKGLNDIRIVHRLDRLTSGLLLFAKNLSAAQSFHDQMLDHHVQKQYICRVQGEFPAEPITSEDPIECVNVRAGIHQVQSGGRSCVTEFDRLSYNPVKNTSIVRCKPLTGRTHQIRVHLQHIGYPIVNDPIYGPGCPKWVPDIRTGSARQIVLETKAAAELSDRDPAAVIPPTEDIPQCVLEKTSRNLFVNSVGMTNEDDPVGYWEKRDKLPDEPWVDEKCPECWIDFKDPKPEDLRIDLHAWKYEGPGWKFETELPVWAKE